MQISDKISLALIKVCQRHPAIVAAYIFGSYAKEKAGPESDIDMAVLLDEQASPYLDQLSFIVEIERETAARVDVVVLNSAGEVLKYQVRKHGKLIFDRNPVLRKNFEVRSRKFFEDFLYLHRKYTDKVLYGS
jgi:predicted nucleotidyltransferase